MLARPTNSASGVQAAEQGWLA